MSFGGGDDPSNTSFQTQFQRDAPQIEARKLGLMDVAKEYTMFGQNPWEAIAHTAPELPDGPADQLSCSQPPRSQEWQWLTQSPYRQE